MAAETRRDVPTVAGVVQQAVPQATPTFPVTWETGAFTGFTALLVTIGISWARKRLSGDSNQVDQNRADGLTTKMLLDVNKALTVENERLKEDAREAWSARLADAGVRAENEFLKRELEHAHQTITEIRRGVMAVGQNVDLAKTSLERASKNIDSGMVPLRND